MQQSSFTQNLLIVQTVPEQDPSDWIAIKERIERDAPDIEVRIAENGNRNSVTTRWQVRRPSLVFSPVRLMDFVPRGGAVYCGHVLGKDEQLRRLSSIGILTPRTATLSSASSFEPGEWGEYVIVKPNNLNSGAGVKLVRTDDLPARYDELTADCQRSVPRRAIRRSFRGWSPDRIPRPEFVWARPCIAPAIDGARSGHR